MFTTASGTFARLLPWWVIHPIDCVCFSGAQPHRYTVTMDNPQHYQPLSHALNPPVNTQVQPTFTSTMYPPKPPGPAAATDDHEEEEEEEGEDEDDEGIIEEQLSRTEPDVLPGNSPAQNQNRQAL